MSFYKEIYPFIEYISSIRKLENYLSFDMMFPTRWSLPKSMLDDSQLVAFDTKNPNLKGVSFVSQIDEREITSTLVKIAKVIKLNKEKEMKEKLFKETIERLKTTFEKNDLDKLKNLYFDFESQDTKLDIDESNSPERETDELVGEREE